MKSSIDNISAIREFHIRKHNKEILEMEEMRKYELEYAKDCLRKYFEGIEGCKVYLFGSILRPGKFHQKSDIDIAVKDFKGSRLELYTDISVFFNHEIDVVLMEDCSFADEIIKTGEILKG
jgi:predicted nucleotidyltransferase